MKTNTKGTPFPLGASHQTDGWNFAVFSNGAVQKLIVAPLHSPDDISILKFDPNLTRTDSIWHIFYPSDETELLYAYCIDDTLLVDPYGKIIVSGSHFGTNIWKSKTYTNSPVTLALAQDDFDWEGDSSPKHKLEELIIYEMHVRGFTQHSSSKAHSPGTFLGMIEKIPYLKQLGVSAIELLPIFEFDETDNPNSNPKTKKPLCNFWGYQPLSFFSAMQRYATSDDPIESLHECKEMVKAMHKAGIEVLLDIVFNHTGEGNEHGRTISWKGFAPTVYYLRGEHGEYLNFSGCGNTLNCNHPVVADMIIESLRYWIVEMHVDGFRFDLASIMTRGQDGSVLEVSPLLERITQDPIISHSKLIAEPWDAAGLHQVGHFFQTPWQGPEEWLEWNDDYRMTVRHFIKGTNGYAGKFATKLCGSQDLYGKEGGPLNSINYITCHDGFTMRDAVSYQQKHNEDNGESNRDGGMYYDTWNCGVEGPTKDAHIEVLRERQMKNFCLALFVSFGIPMFQMGDEYGHTKNGNNNSWCHDNDLNWFLWSELEHEASLVHFWKEMIQLRSKNPLLKRTTFLRNDDIEWHGLKPFHADWSETSHFVAYTLIDHALRNDLYIAFNAQNAPSQVILPPPPPKKSWSLLVNTGLLPPQDIQNGSAPRIVSKEIKMIPYSAILLKAIPFESSRQ